jgi:hypothetical protein
MHTRNNEEVRKIKDWFSGLAEDFYDVSIQKLRHDMGA